MKSLLSILILFSVSKSPANPLKKFLDRTVEVKQLGVEEPQKFFDIFRSNERNGQSDQSSPYYNNTAWHGICIDINKPQCVRSYQRRSYLARSYAQAQGLSQVDENIFEQISNAKIEATSTYKVAKDKLIISTTKRFDKKYYKAQFEISIPELISDKQIEFSQPSNDVSDRTGIKNEIGNKHLSLSVVQIARGPFRVSDLLGNQVKSGTGFFVTIDGLLLTNYHVVSSYHSCIKELFCEITYRQFDEEGKIKEFRAPTRLYAESPDYDFALLKVDLPPEIQVRPLELETQKVGSQILTLGFPGDLLTPDKKNTDLTFSRGLLTGFHLRTFATSAYVFSGASGSPLLNFRNNKVIGIISNTAGQPVKVRGTPGLARPMDVIDADYEIRDYISGEKQARIDEIISELIGLSTDNQVNALMADYAFENSFYGSRRLLRLMTDHKNGGVRLAIRKGLQKRD